MNSSPSLTFVVIPLVGGAALERCIAALHCTPAAIIVVGRIPAALADRVRSRGGMAIDSIEPVPRRRALGAAHAHSDWIAFCEDTCEIGANWYATFESVSRAAIAGAWGGPIEICDGLSARCMALALLEYGEFAAHRRQGLGTAPGATWQPAARIAGLVPLYSTSALPWPPPAEGLIETEVNAAIAASGKPLALHGGLAVRYCADDTASATFASRYSHGRIYGGGQRASLHGLARVAALAKCLLLPLVLGARGLAGLPRARRADPRSIAWLMGFALAWSVGEAVGLVFGRGASLAAWR